MLRQMTAYDAAYVALARGLSLPLVTAEDALVHRLRTTDLDVRWLGQGLSKPVRRDRPGPVPTQA
jgi:hypothetical protein